MNKKRFSHLAIYLFLFCFLFQPFPSNAKVTQPKFTFSDHIVKVGVFDSAGFWNVNGGDVSGGYAYDYLKAISNYTGWKFEFVTTTLSDAITMLESGKLDMLLGLQQTDQRLETLSFPTNNIGTEFGVVVTKPNNLKLAYNDINSLNGTKIGCLKGNVYSYKHFPDYCKEKNIECDLIEYPTEKEMFKALNTGKVDAILTNDISNFSDNRIIVKFHAAPIYCATTKDNSYIIEGVDFALDNLQLDNPAFGAETYAKYYNKQNSELSLTRDELNYLANTNIPIKVALLENRAPYSAQNQQNEFYGIIPDVFKEIEKLTNLSFTFVPVKTDSQAIRMLREGALDIIPNYWTVLPVDSKTDASLTSPYLKYDLVTIFHQDNTKFKKKKKRTLGISMSVSDVKEYFDDNSKLEYSVYETDEDCVEAMIRGDVDGIICNYYFAQQILSQTQYSKYKFMNFNFPDDSIHQKSMCVSTESGPELFTIINKSIRSVKINSLTKIISSNSILQAPEFSFNRWMQNNLFFILFFLCIIVAILICFLFYASTSRQKYSKMLNTDSLTNGLSLNRFLSIATKLNQGYFQYELVKTNIIHFRFINDLYGKEVGDGVLQLFHDLMQTHLSTDECVARQEADHFLVLKKKNSNSDKILLQIFHSISDEVYRIYGINLKINGGGYLLKKNESITSSIEKTSHVLADLGEEQSGIIQLYDERREKIVNALSLIETDMESAFTDHQFVPYFQPKYDIDSNSIVGAEALVRWKHPVHGLIPPMDFLPYLENSGAIINLDFYMLEESCKFIRKHKDATGNWITLSSNFSTKHFVYDNFCSRVIAIADRYQIPHEYIELEVTETMSMADTDIVKTLFRQLHENKFLISIDDFGSGYSSLGILESFDIDILKLDRSFMQTNMQTQNINMIRGITEIADNNGMKMICEGVETKEQVEILKSTKCHIVQGYYYSKPLSETDFILLLMGK